MSARFIQAVVISEYQLAAFLRTGAIVRCVEGVPDDATCSAIYYDPARRAIVAHFEHPSFPRIEDGAMAFNQFAVFEMIDDPQVYAALQGIAATLSAQYDIGVISEERAAAWLLGDLDTTEEPQ